MGREPLDPVFCSTENDLPGLNLSGDSVTSKLEGVLKKCHIPALLFHLPSQRRSFQPHGGIVKHHLSACAELCDPWQGGEQ